MLNRLQNYPDEENPFSMGIEDVTDYAMAANNGRRMFPVTAAGLFSLWKLFPFLLAQPLLFDKVERYTIFVPEKQNYRELFDAVMETTSLVVVAVFKYVTTFLQSFLGIRAMDVHTMASSIAPCLTLKENPEQPIIDFIAFAIGKKFDGFQLNAFKAVHVFKVHVRGAFLYRKCKSLKDDTETNW